VVLHGSPTTITTTSKDDALPVEQGGPKDQLLSALKDLTLFGFDALNEDRARISALANDLAGYSLPLEEASTTEWELMYTDAPDILGFRGGPLSQLVSIRQKVTGTTAVATTATPQLDIVLEYKPSDGIAALTQNFIENVENDRLQQTIMFEYQKEPMNKINLKLKGTKIDASRFGSLPVLESPATLPFGSFKVLFNDGDLCIQQTVQGGFNFIYRRI